jgi:hypothetical protein
MLCRTKSSENKLHDVHRRDEDYEEMPFAALRIINDIDIFKMSYHLLSPFVSSVSCDPAFSFLSIYGWFCGGFVETGSCFSYLQGCLNSVHV